MSDERTERMEQARVILFANAVEAARDYLGSAWEDVPLIGEHDFMTVRDEVTAMLSLAYYQPRRLEGDTHD